MRLPAARATSRYEDPTPLRLASGQLPSSVFVLLLALMPTVFNSAAGSRASSGLHARVRDLQVDGSKASSGVDLLARGHAPLLRGSRAFSWPLGGRFPLCQAIGGEITGATPRNPSLDLNPVPSRSPSLMPFRILISTNCTSRRVRSRSRWQRCRRPHATGV